VINNPIFKKLQKVAVNYTAEQIQNATAKQILAIVGDEYKELLTIAFINNMKRILIAELEHKQLLSARDAVRDKILAYFPDAEFDITKENDKRKVTIWLDGRPE